MCRGITEAARRGNAGPLDSGRSRRSLAANVLILFIEGYRRVVSPYLPPSCRYHPTCSQYAQEAIARFGAGRGAFMALRRLLRCHPFHPGGYDPVES